MASAARAEPATTVPAPPDDHQEKERHDGRKETEHRCPAGGRPRRRPNAGRDSRQPLATAKKAVATADGALAKSRAELRKVGGEDEGGILQSVAALDRCNQYGQVADEAMDQAAEIVAIVGKVVK